MAFTIFAMYFINFALSFTLSLAAARDEDPTWHRYVRSPGSKVVKPTGILLDSIVGNVSNPTGLIHGLGATVLSRSNDIDLLPTIVVDFGQNVVGILSLEFSGSQNMSTGLPGLRLAFSETLEYLSDRSDFTRSDNANGVCHGWYSSTGARND
jgi:hypothetical protein